MPLTPERVNPRLSVIAMICYNGSNALLILVLSVQPISAITRLHRADLPPLSSIKAANEGKEAAKEGCPLAEVINSD